MGIFAGMVMKWLKALFHRLRQGLLSFRPQVPCGVRGGGLYEEASLQL
jgi:hypothetical protein